MFCAEELLGAITGDVLDHIRELASAIVATARIAFRILIGENRTGGFKHCLADEVFRGDHLEALVLAADFILNGGSDLRIGL